MDRTCLVRTVSHPYNSHNPYAVMTGYTGGQDQRETEDNVEVSFDPFLTH